VEKYRLRPLVPGTDAYAFYQGAQGTILPTRFTPASTPRLYPAIKHVDASFRAQVRETMGQLESLGWGLAIGIVLGVALGPFLVPKGAAPREMPVAEQAPVSKLTSQEPLPGPKVAKPPMPLGEAGQTPAPQATWVGSGKRGRYAQPSQPEVTTLSGPKSPEAGAKPASTEGPLIPTKHMPDPAKWIEAKGRYVPQSADSITYTDAQGNAVTYRVTFGKFHADFRPYETHPTGVKEVEIKFTQNRAQDFRAANEKAGHPEWGDQSPPGYTWHHHEDGKTMQLVLRSIHDLFKHVGGFSEYPCGD
jgi:hypothetical protein